MVLALVPPALAFAVGAWSAGSPRMEPTVPPAPSPTTSPASQAAPPPPAAPPMPACDDPLLDELVEVEARWAQHEHEIAFRQARAEDALYDAIESCDIELDVAAVDCREIPCLILTYSEETNWWNSLGVCPAWYDLYGGGGTYFSTTVPCRAGGEEHLELMEEPRNFYGIDEPERDEGPDEIMRAMKVDSLVLQARLEDLAADWECAPQTP